LIVSVLAPSAAAGVLYFGLTHFVRIDDRSLLERYSVRQLDLHAIDPPGLDSPFSSMATNDYYPDTESRFSLSVPPELRTAMRSFIESVTEPQTLIQPEFPHLTFAEQLRVPNHVVWAPELAPGRKIVFPLPTPTREENVTLSLELPNEELWPINIGVSPTRLPPRSDTLFGETTSPVRLLSERSVETVRLPLANEVAPAVTLRPTSSPLQTSAFAAPANNRTGLGGKAASRADTGRTDDDAIDDSRLTTERLVLPKSGRFGVVVVGNTMGEDYPESIEFWGNRVAYTAYLHVGVSKNWILQYSVLRAAEVADAGAVTRLEAPWPYDILRPSLTSLDLSTDALMIHGILTSAGRFESLAIASPSRFRYTSFVLHALGQWQFRPARRNGQAIAVEVLLIIPIELK
jgi:hypothetical protein